MFQTDGARPSFMTVFRQNDSPSAVENSCRMRGTFAAMVIRMPGWRQNGPIYNRGDFSPWWNEDGIASRRFLLALPFLEQFALTRCPPSAVLEQKKLFAARHGRVRRFAN